jgi:hypothetical protein
MFTVGIATYDDYDGLYFTVQSIKMYHPLVTEIIIIDNNPDSKFGICNKTLERESTSNCVIKYIPCTEKKSTTVKGEAFKYTTNEYVIICDSHILFPLNSFECLQDYYINHHKPYDLIQGPLLYDNLNNISTHLERKWRGNFYGTWATANFNEPFFEIPAMGMGVFSCKRDEWLGFNSLFTGFGGEEFYIHDKYRKHGGRCICLMGFKWVHRFNRPIGVPYINTLEDRCFNYFIGRFELDQNYTDVADNFINNGLSKQDVERIFVKAYSLYTKNDVNR